MFEIGDFLMYGKTGVCQLRGISKEALLDKKEVWYYVLQPVFKNSSAVIKMPVDNKRINIRRVASREQILAFMEQIAASEPIWNNNDRSRFEEYDENLCSGSCLEWMDMIRQIYLKKKESKTSDKKISPRDIGVSKEAKRLLHEELSISLEIPLEDVEKTIVSKLASMEKAYK